ncbi:MAG: hypothetical protein EA401_03530 [Planctomycetota bacterium]|nr:MAG: hypothetical protein EA401_03530 [Planctomycetota bacterium]
MTPGKAFGNEGDQEQIPRLPIDPTSLSWSAGSGLSLPAIMVDGQVVAYPPQVTLPDRFPEDFFGPIYQPSSDQVQADAPGSFSGGVTMLYERIRLQADRLEFWQRPLLDDDESAWPQRVLLLPGDDGPEPNRVHLDSRYSDLPIVSFTGLLRPRRIVVDRAPFSGEPGELVLYRIVLEDVGHFRGELRLPDQGWRTVTGHAEHILIRLHAQRMSDGRMSEPMIESFHLFALGDEGAWLTLWADPAPVRFASRRISMEFRDDGALQRFEAGKDAHMSWLEPGSEVPQHDAYEVLRDPQQERAQQRRRARKD